MAWRVVLTTPSLSGARAAVWAGLGVGVRTARWLESEIRVVQGGLPPLPPVEMAIYGAGGDPGPAAGRDEYLALGLGEAAQRVAGHALLFEELLARELGAKRLDLKLKPAAAGTPPLLVHGHCHEKAAGAMKSLRKVLKLVPGLEFELVEASCCGMAGSFGLEAEHAGIAMEMAEQALLPALRERPEAEVLANGFSCRHQIREGTGREAVPLAVVLARALG